MLNDFIIICITEAIVKAIAKPIAETIVETVVEAIIVGRYGVVHIGPLEKLRCSLSIDGRRNIGVSIIATIIIITVATVESLVCSTRFHCLLLPLLQ